MRSVLAIIFLLLFCVPAYADPGAGEVRAGNDLYRKGNFSEAMEHYEKAALKNPSEARIEYDLGAAAYQAKDYDAAVEHFQKSLLTDNDKFRRDVHFNLGDAFYRAGILQEDKELDQAIKRLESSLGSFEKAIALDPKDQPSAENYLFVKKEIERLKQKKEQQQQQKKQQQDQQQKQDQQKQDQQLQDQKQDQKQDEQQKKDQPQDQQKSEEQKKQEQGEQEKRGQEKKDQEKKDQAQKDQEQKDQEKRKQQEQKDQPKPDSAGNDQNNSASGQMAEGQISSQKDANDMVDNFERNELPKGLLNFIHKQAEARPVDKDW